MNMSDKFLKLFLNGMKRWMAVPGSCWQRHTTTLTAKPRATWADQW